MGSVRNLKGKGCNVTKKYCFVYRIIFIVINFKTEKGILSQLVVYLCTCSTAQCMYRGMYWICIQYASDMYQICMSCSSAPNTLTISALRKHKCICRGKVSFWGCGVVM